MVDDEERRKSPEVILPFRMNIGYGHVYRTSLFSAALEFQVILNPKLIDWLYAAKREFQRPLFVFDGIGSQEG